MNDSIKLPHPDCNRCQGSGTKMVVPLFNMSKSPIKHIDCDCQDYLEELRRSDETNAFKQGEEL